MGSVSDARCAAFRGRRALLRFPSTVIVSRNKKAASGLGVDNFTGTPAHLAPLTQLFLRVFFLLRFAALAPKLCEGEWLCFHAAIITCLQLRVFHSSPEAPTQP